MSFTFCFSSIAVITSLALVINYGLTTGGPVIMVWGWIVSCIFTLMIGASIAEICSVYPAAGSVYYWAGVLSHPDWAPINSFYCGWLNMIGNMACESSFAFGFAQVFSAIISLVNDGQVTLSDQKQVLIAIVTLIMWAIKNRLRLDQQGWYNNFSAIYQCISTIFLVTAIIICSSNVSSHEFVWTNYNNETGFESVIYVCMIGVLMSMYGMSGYESGATLAEETKNASHSAPRGIINSIILSSVIGFIFILGLLYSSQENIFKALNGVSQQSVINIIDVTFTDEFSNERNYFASVTLSVILMLNIFLAGFSHMTGTTRITYALARDNGLPKSEWMKQLNPRTSNPDRVLLVVLIIDSLLCTLPLLSTLAFTAITSIATIGYQLSYAIPIFLRVTQSRKTFKQSLDYNIGKYSVINSWVSFLWLIISSLVLFFPLRYDPQQGITAQNFNYTASVMLGALMIASIFWIFPLGNGARNYFRGPQDLRKYNGEEIII
ncbi:uncharacterized amino-acid permease-like [Stylonychia lemnae]|uniref:Uncharacterized amino-acid permease-like n=1 Tax=Stylonychia lemnae TaxID=5949 RepID=A0A078AFJ2_STYLE|nr:uncharacterized amino-acid permease-like [Stylonychia lemnae]|eukprot:CDW80970.1 uncharacterized amino-acid permease-like [Stylonychia lemnae]